jgi:hypothetical protein
MAAEGAMRRSLATSFVESLCTGTVPTSNVQRPFNKKPPPNLVFFDEM